MFYRGYSMLTGLARPESLPSPLAPEALTDWAEDEARRALARPLGFMALSERLQKPAAYQRLQRERRQSLEALLHFSLNAAVSARVNDLICAIAEESSWAENPDGALFDDEAHPEIDFQCAETAMLFGWTLRAFGGKLDSRVAGKLVYEVRRRVFSPFLAHQDYPFMRGRGPRPLCILSDVLLCSILLESDGSRRAAIQKQALRLIDQVITWRDRRLEPLADAAAETAAVTDLALLLRMATRGELDETGDYPTPDWLDGLLFPWIDGDQFLDPATGDMHPPLSGAELFRVGLTAGDEALTALGARLRRTDSRPSTTVTGRLLDMSCASALSAHTGKLPRLKQAATPHNRLMVSRFSGFTCAMHTGGHANAGDIVLYYNGKPILVETSSGGNLPQIDGKGQLPAPDVACEADYELRQDREAMSIELTHAYPASAYLRSYQRTAMIMRPDGIMRAQGMLRLVEALDLTAPGKVAFQLLTPEKPAHRPDGLRLGAVELSWDGGLIADYALTEQHFPESDPLGAPLYCVTLTTPAPVTRAFFALVFAAAQD